MKKIILSSISTFLATLLLVAAPAAAARPADKGRPSGGGGKTTTPLGNDISWPQCGNKLPRTHAFGIVGVNGGLANTTNPCLSEQLVWASRAVGGTSQDKVQLYVNTANPGGLNTESWPVSNTDPAGGIAPNPHGTCDGSDTIACAWQYGWNRAVEDVIDRFQPAAATAGIPGDPASYIWWLDVETENTWKESGSALDYASNAADLEGMTAYFLSRGTRVGLYSTASQWNQIVGTAVTESSNLNGLPNWRPGGANLQTAQDACTAAPLTPDGSVVLTQFVSRNLDYNYSCVQ